ncbi:hypothetical protein [Agrobacterium pusense]|uniref:hypothetical protein n=1 Tax=Agrobacterium pusense TaxID=648995 RepID=UPI0026BF27C0
MKDKPDDLGYWAGWFAAFAIAAIFFIYIVWQNQTLRQIACDAGENDCFRQWMSALGGWAAMVVAIPTIIYLAKQVRDGDRHHRINAAFTHRRQRLLAASVSKYCITLKETTEYKLEFLSAENEEFRTDDVLDNVNHVLELLAATPLKVFENEIFTPTISVDFIVARIQRNKAKLDSQGSPELLDEEILHSLKINLAAVVRYADGIQRNCDAFLNETAAFVFNDELHD